MPQRPCDALLDLPKRFVDLLLERARRCQAERHRLPNLVVTDFYDTGGVVGAARVLNGLGDQRPAPIVALERSAG